MPFSTIPRQATRVGKRFAHIPLRLPSPSTRSAAAGRYSAASQWHLSAPARWCSRRYLSTPAPQVNQRYGLVQTWLIAFRLDVSNYCLISKWLAKWEISFVLRYHYGSFARVIGELARWTWQPKSRSRVQRKYSSPSPVLRLLISFYSYDTERCADP